MVWRKAKRRRERVTERGLCGRPLLLTAEALIPRMQKDGQALSVTVKLFAAWVSHLFIHGEYFNPRQPCCRL